MFKHTCSFGGWGEHTLLLLGFQRGLTFQKLRTVNYFPDKEIKECTQVHMIDYYRKKYDNVNLHVKIRIYFISHLSKDDDTLNVYKETCIA